MSTVQDNKRKALSAFIRQDLAKQVRILQIDLEDLLRRQQQGFPPTLTAVAARGLSGNVLALVELICELKGVDLDPDAFNQTAKEPW